MNKHILASTAALAISVALGGPVKAADMPFKAGPAALFNWSGYYIGGHLGYGGSRFASEISQPGADKTAKGLVGGLQLGYNWQAGNIVYGLEGDLSASGMSGNISDNAFHSDLLASLRARLGLAYDRVLIYGTGGIGYVHGRVFSSGAGNANPFNFDKFRPVVGLGIEYAATNNLIYRIEGLDYIGKESINGEDSGGNKLKNIWVGRVGVSYKY